MTILTHAVLGSLTGFFSPNLPVASGLGITSHFLSDFVPHNDYFYLLIGKNKNPYTSFLSQLVLLVTTAFFVFLITRVPGNKRAVTISGALFAVVPDVLTGLWATLDLKPSLFDKFHGLTHSRLTLAELLYNRDKLVEPILPSDHLLDNFDKIKTSKRVQIGWVVELLFELVVFTSALLGLLLAI